MPEDWDVFLRRIDGQPAMIFADLLAGEAGPDPERTYALRIAFALQHPGEDGLGTEEESETLYQLEDELFKALCASDLGSRYVGRITDEEKYDALSGAFAVVVPSKYESLSLLALEGFAYGSPVLVNGASDVLRGQIERSGAGAVFTDIPSFPDAVAQVAQRRAELGRKGKAFARRHTWEKVVGTSRAELERVMGENRKETRR